MTSLSTDAAVLLPDPVPTLRRMLRGLARTGIVAPGDGPLATIAFEFGACVLEARSGRLLLRAEAATLSELLYLRMGLAAHLADGVSAPCPAPQWSGPGDDLVTPEHFRLVRVVAVRSVTPHVRRLTLAGWDMARFASDEHIHVGLMIPQDGTDPAWPALEPGGQVTWPSGPGCPALRRYTIRRHDMEAGTVDIDFVVHDDGGPGSDFALRAKRGDIVGMAGPGGGGIAPAADWLLLAGDDTALPAIARMLETLPAEARGVALLEVEEAADEQALVAPAGIEIRWLHRQGAAPGPLAEAVRQLEFPRDGRTIFAWAAGEFDAFRAIRSHLRQERGLAKGQHFVVAYWRRGRADDDARPVAEED